MSLQESNQINDLLANISKLTEGIDGMMGGINEIVSKSIANMGEESQKEFLQAMKASKTDEKIEDVKKEIESLKTSLNIKF
jgi:SMC interacting uncharacterized protein involved in chromosome segregation